MGNLARLLTWVTGGVLALTALARPAGASLDADWAPAEVFAVAIGTDLKQGYTLRAESWHGDLPAGEAKPIAQQLFKGNSYHFYAAAFEKNARVSVHAYDADGNIADAETWDRTDREGQSFAGVAVQPKRTGTYYLIIRVEHSPAARTEWGMAYAFR